MSKYEVTRKYEVEVDDNHLQSIRELGLPEGGFLYQATFQADMGTRSGWLYCVSQNTGERDPETGSFIWETKWGTLEDFQDTQFRSLYGPVHFTAKEIAFDQE